MKNNMIDIICIVGTAGSGKDTILQNVCSHCGEDVVHPIISYTTRPRRDGEQDGKDYYFITETDFKKMIYNNEMIEYTVFNNWYYGITINSFSKDKPNIGIFNPEGIEKLKTFKNLRLIVYPITASPKTRLLRQINREINPNIAEICRRFLADQKDFDLYEHWAQINETAADFSDNVFKICSYIEGLWAENN